jgi:hypothetical protein
VGDAATTSAELMSSPDARAEVPLKYWTPSTTAATSAAPPRTLTMVAWWSWTQEVAATARAWTSSSTTSSGSAASSTGLRAAALADFCVAFAALAAAKRSPAVSALRASGASLAGVAGDAVASLGEGPLSVGSAASRSLSWSFSLATSALRYGRA